MSAHSGAIKRAGPPAAGVSGQAGLPPAAAISTGRVAPQLPNTAVLPLSQAAPADVITTLDARLAERMHGLLLSPAMASMTQRCSVLHSVVSWLEAQSASSSGALAPVVDVLKQEIFLIEAFHRGALHDVEGPRE